MALVDGFMLCCDAERVDERFIFGDSSTLLSNFIEYYARTLGRIKAFAKKLPLETES